MFLGHLHEIEQDERHRVDALYRKHTGITPRPRKETDDMAGVIVCDDYDAHIEHHNHTSWVWGMFVTVMGAGILVLCGFLAYQWLNQPKAAINNTFDPTKYKIEIK